MTTLQKYLAVGVVVLLAILGFVSFGSHKFGATAFQQGEVYVNPAIWVNGFSGGSSQQFIVDASGNVQTSGTLTGTGATTVSTLTQGGGSVATTTILTASTLLAATIATSNLVEMTPGGASWSLTLPASSTLTTFIPTAGQTRTIYFRNATTTAGINITLVGGAGTVLRTSSSTAIIQSDTAGAKYAKVDFIRQTNTDISVLVTPYNN